MFNTTEVIANLELQWASKVLRHLAVKFNFRVSWTHFPPFPPKQCWYFYFLHSTDHNTHATLNWGAGVHCIRDLTLHANKLEQMQTSLGPRAKKDSCFRRQRKASFPESISTTFVAHYNLIIYESLMRSQSIVHLIWLNFNLNSHKH